MTFLSTIPLAESIVADGDNPFYGGGGGGYLSQNSPFGSGGGSPGGSGRVSASVTRISIV